MRLLLDTQTLLWWLVDDDRLSPPARDALLSPDNELWVSNASLWEIAIKISIGKLRLREGWPSIIEQQLAVNQIRQLPVELSHCVQVTELPFHHRDPFDRMLIAQSLVERLTMVTRDQNIHRYAIETLW